MEDKEYGERCWRCMTIFRKHQNVLQYRESEQLSHFTSLYHFTVFSGTRFYAILLCFWSTGLGFLVPLCTTLLCFRGTPYAILLCFWFTGLCFLVPLCTTLLCFRGPAYSILLCFWSTGLCFLVPLCTIFNDSTEKVSEENLTTHFLQYYF